MRFFHSLRFRLLVGLSMLLFLLFGLYSYFAVRLHSDHMMQQTFLSANRISDFIKSSTHYSMLLNRKEDVYEIISTIGTQPGMEGIRIYNKRGEITYSTDAQETGQIVDLRAEACFVCHDTQQPLVSLSTDNRTRVYEGSRGHRVLGLINPIRNEPSCSEAGCHSHPAEKTVLGVLDIRMSLKEVDEAIADQQWTMVVFAVVMIAIIGTGSFAFVQSTVHRPVQQLIEGTRRVSAGDLDHITRVESTDEIGRLAESFNDMTTSLRAAQAEIRSWTQTLEERVEEKTNERQRMHEQMLQVEKMASLGKLSASVAHELNNPLEGILTYAKLHLRKLQKRELLDEEQQRLAEDLDLIVRETQRCGSIVKNLLLFSKKQVGEVGLVPVREIVEKVARIVRHHFEISGVVFKASYTPEDVAILCDENQIQQALVALFVNGVEAMPGGGTLQLEASANPSGVVTLAIKDAGMGIGSEHLPHIFEPFYTTKEDAGGVGLGLSVVYAIVDRHNGTISVQSEEGRGTTFILRFPGPTEKRNLVDESGVSVIQKGP
jgi:two-component system NtrC family sensor kinase